MSSVQFASEKPGVVVADRCNKWDNDVTVQATRGIIIRVLSPFPFVHQEIALPSDVLSSLDMLGSILSEFFHPRIFITFKSTRQKDSSTFLYLIENFFLTSKEARYRGEKGEKKERIELARPFRYLSFNTPLLITLPCDDRSQSL